MPVNERGEGKTRSHPKDTKHTKNRKFNRKAAETGLNRLQPGSAIAKTHSHRAHRGASGANHPFDACSGRANHQSHLAKSVLPLRPSRSCRVIFCFVSVFVPLCEISDKMSKIGLGIVGGGTIAQRVLRHLVQPDVPERVSLTGICDPVADRARAAAEKFGIARWFSGYQELLACDEVDAVTIASPINFHFEQVRQALLASKHVHCNKAMATTGAEAKELTRLAREHNLRLVPSPGEMLRPHNQYIKEVIHRGGIGTLCWAVCGAAFGNYHEDESERQGNDVLSNVDPSWYFRKPGGGHRLPV